MSTPLQPDFFWYGPRFTAVYGAAELKRGAYVFLHGFPAEKGEKNQDLAELLARELAVATVVPHYEGLGRSGGEFSFVGSILRTFEMLEELQRSGVPTFRLIGHSWGGLVAANLAATGLPIHSLLLLSPLTAVPMAAEWERVLTQVATEYPKFEPWLPRLRTEMELIRTNYAPSEVLHRWPALLRGAVFQALEDAEIPAAVTRSWAASLPPTFHYQELDQDHEFSNRLLLGATLLRWCRKHPMSVF